MDDDPQAVEPADGAVVTEPDEAATPAGPSHDATGGDAPADGAVGRIVTLEDPEHPARHWTDTAGWLLAFACSLGVFVALNPQLIFRNTTPTGGDMGAHVWGPDFLKDHLLPHLRLTGWTSDWYAGFPAYTYYMVIPPLVIVWLSTGLPLVLGIPLAALVVAGGWWLQRRLHTVLSRVVMWCAVVFLAGLSVGIPYNVAFKVVTVLGLVTLPLAANALGRAGRLPFPGPPLLALGATLFVFERGYSILGGNILSTMAGEFSFSISLSLAVAYLAVMFRGIETGRYRALGGLLFGLVVMTHLIPTVFAVIATVVLVFVRREDRVPWWDRERMTRWVAVGAVGLVLVVLWLVPNGFPVVGTFVAVVMLVGFDRRAFRFAAVALPVGACLAAWWFLPFYLNSPFMNDMGWEKYTNYSQYLWPQPAQFDMSYRNLWFALAAAGMVLSLVHRVRIGWFLTLTLVTFGWAFVFLPQYRLWNARLLPFYFLAVYLLAGLGVALIVRAVAVVAADLLHRREEPAGVDLAGALVVGAMALVFLLGSFGQLPGTEAATTQRADGTSTSGWKAWGIVFPQNNASGWAAYNYSGVEDPAKAYPEFSAVMRMMRGVGEEHGCGQTMWEYESQLDRFGTPMALMLLPYFTDGCIGSMEGLYFESSSTTPFHFINQSELSKAPSRPQRDLPYPEYDLDAGVRHLQLMGVRYFLAFTPEVIADARANADLTELASTDAFKLRNGQTRQWAVFQVADSDPVVPLANLPVVVTPEDDHIDGWVYADERPEGVPGGPVPAKLPGPAIEWYLDPSRWDVPLATSGPQDWPRVARGDAADAPREPVRPAKVSDVEVGEDWFTFRVDEPGTPVLVRASYFPNWKVDGAEGPWRVSPNFMVVVPTSEEVHLSYGYTWRDYLGWMLTWVGIACVVVLARADQRRRDADEAVFGVSGDGVAVPRS